MLRGGFDEVRATIGGKKREKKKMGKQRKGSFHLSAPFFSLRCLQSARHLHPIGYKTGRTMRRCAREGA